MKLIPVHNYVLIDPIEHRVSQIIETPDMYKPKPRQGVVIGKGIDATPEIAEGMHVMFDQHASVEFEVDGKKQLVISDKSILCAVRK